LVVRSHLYIEAVLTQLIEERLEEPYALDLERLNFNTKLNLAVALGAVQKSEKPALVLLNRLRNRFAHKLNAQITKQDARQFLNSFASEQRKEIKGGTHFANTIPYLHRCLYGRLRRREP
jgi:hypothetical protein